VQLPLGDGNAGEDENKRAVLRARIGKGLGIGINGDFRLRAVPDRLGFARSFNDISHGAFGKPLLPFGLDPLELFQDA
jgi:hypothetical protein